jgi:hypothetical protein
MHTEENAVGGGTPATMSTSQVAKLLGVRPATLLRLRRESLVAGIAAPCEWARRRHRWSVTPILLCRWIAAVIEHRSDPFAAPGAQGDDATPSGTKASAQGSLAQYARSLTAGR